MTRRRALILILLCALLTVPLAAGAQQPSKTPVIGFLGVESAAGYARQVEALRAGLRDLGYVEGKTIVIEFRWAEGKLDRLAGLAAELVRLKVDIIVTHSGPGVRAAKQATRTIPIVMGSVGGDLVASGLVASLARPGGNITGSASISMELGAKRLELIKEADPRTQRVAVLQGPATRAAPPDQRLETAARLLKLELHKFAVRESSELDTAFAAMTKRGVDAVFVYQETMLITNAKRIADLAVKRRLPSIGAMDFPEAGGLIGYGQNPADAFRHAAYFVDKILKGAKPADLPIEQPAKIELIINLKTAKALGLTIPPSLLLRADEVIQ